MTNILTEFKELKSTSAELKAALGTDLYNVENITPLKISAKDVIFAIEQYLSQKVSTEKLVDWVNIIWFTDLFYYNAKEEDAISSVLSLLETLDEDGVNFTQKDFMCMIESLKSNNICTV